MKKSLALIAALGLALPVVPAAAQNDSLRIEYSDLDLGTQAGQKQLDRRIDKAARDFCNTSDKRTGTRIMGPESRECVASVKRQAREQVAAKTGTDEALGG